MYVTGTAVITGNETRMAFRLFCAVIHHYTILKGSGSLAEHASICIGNHWFLVFLGDSSYPD